MFDAARQRGQVDEAEKLARRVEHHFRGTAGLFSSEHQKAIGWTAESLRDLGMADEAAAMMRQFVADVAE